MSTIQKTPLTKTELNRLKRAQRTRSKRNRKSNPTGLPTFKEWTEYNCSICADAMKELCSDPIELNEHMNLNTLCLPCGHYYHATCFLEWFKKQSACPLCRTDYKKEDLHRVNLPPLQCRAIIKKSKHVEKIGTQCECLEYPGNMGFCRKHLPPLSELTERKDKKTDNDVIALKNRKLLTILRYQTAVKEFPDNIRKDILFRALTILKENDTIQMPDLL